MCGGYFSKCFTCFVSFAVHILLKYCVIYVFQLRKFRFWKKRYLTQDCLADIDQPEFLSFSECTSTPLLSQLSWIFFSTGHHQRGLRRQGGEVGISCTWLTVSGHLDLQKAVYFFYQPEYNLSILWACRGQSPLPGHSEKAIRKPQSHQ